MSIKCSDCFTLCSKLYAMIKFCILLTFVAGGLGQQIAKQKCEEYAAAAKSQANAAQCQPLPTTYDVSVDPKLFPANVLLGYESPGNSKPRFSCVGVIISDDIVVTEGVCTSSSQIKNLKFVRLGNETVYTSDVEIKEVIQHPQSNQKTGDYKIALLKLKKKLEPSIVPACLNTQPLTEGEEALHVGMPFGIRNLSIPVTAKLRVEPLKKCVEAFKGNKIAQIIGESYLCVKDPNNGLGDCMIGPLYAAREKCVHTVAGLASYGARCGSGTRHPTAYIKIDPLVHWIESIAWPSV